MKIALINDTHWGIRNDSQFFLDYFKRFVDNIFLQYLDEHQITTVIHLGDIVDRRKYINYNTLKSCRKYFFEKAETFFGSNLQFEFLQFVYYSFSTNSAFRAISCTQGIATWSG